VEFEVEQRRARVLDGREALVEGSRSKQPLQQQLEDRLSGPVVTRIVAQRLWRRHPVLEDLRRELDKILTHRGAGLRAIARPAQKPMQPMPELVEQSLRVVEAQQSRLAFGEVVGQTRASRRVKISAETEFHMYHPGSLKLA
jgi:hypothetical protein